MGWGESDPGSPQDVMKWREGEFIPVGPSGFDGVGLGNRSHLGPPGMAWDGGMDLSPPGSTGCDVRGVGVGS